MNKNCFFLIAGFLSLVSTHLPGFEKIEISQFVSSVGVSVDNSALLIKCLEDDCCWVSGEDLISASYQPCSTAKIPHTLIALEVGYANDPHKVFKWDGQKRFLDVWNQDHTLESAFKHSTLWVYQKITSDLGCEVMSSWIDKLNYGNLFIGGTGDISTYWLDGPLAISVEQQVEFLGNLAQEKLPLSPKTFEFGKSIMREEFGDGWSLYSKTGWSGTYGWYVGWVETNTHGEKKTYVFAFIMDVDCWDELPKRKEVVRYALDRLGII